MAAPASVEAYLAALPEASRVALEGLRAAIRAAAPDATEVISYQMPAFRNDGRLLVSYAAFSKHCSLFPMSLQVVADLRAELAAFDVEKGTIRFRPDQPIPAELVAKVVRARIVENAARGRAARSR
jgi:uncharacterized protein YdhG (YjbR/CyaY superfamily)